MNIIAVGWETSPSSCNERALFIKEGTCIYCGLIMTTQTHSVLHPSADSPSLLLGYFHDQAEHCSLCVLRFFFRGRTGCSPSALTVYLRRVITLPRRLASNLASCRRRHARRCPVIGSAHVKLPKAWLFLPFGVQGDIRRRRAHSAFTFLRRARGYEALQARRARAAAFREPFGSPVNRCLCGL